MSGSTTEIVGGQIIERAGALTRQGCPPSRSGSRRCRHDRVNAAGAPIDGPFLSGWMLESAVLVINDLIGAMTTMNTATGDILATVMEQPFVNPAGKFRQHQPMLRIASASVPHSSLMFGRLGGWVDWVRPFSRERDRGDVARRCGRAGATIPRQRGA
ncbi:hypothetical protein [Amycolatopsis vastitatis]|uniref:hypothetical protein n=1 Tax=Amycolatopsis vastitatis TaxID=1905142 RepID=UPI001177678B|nr:hypothetical protein [Amycolatopsis vastitatis]